MGTKWTDCSISIPFDLSNHACSQSITLCIAVPFRPWAIIIRQLHKEFAAVTAIPLSEEKRQDKFDSRLKLGKERGGNVRRGKDRNTKIERNYPLIWQKLFQMLLTQQLGVKIG